MGSETQAPERHTKESYMSMMDEIGELSQYVRRPKNHDLGDETEMQRAATALLDAIDEVANLAAILDRQYQAVDDGASPESAEIVAARVRNELSKPLIWGDQY